MRCDAAFELRRIESALGDIAKLSGDETSREFNSGNADAETVGSEAAEDIYARSCLRRDN